MEEKVAAAEDEQEENGSNKDNDQPNAKKQRTFNSFGDDDSRFPVERTVGDDMPMEVKQVTEDGWIFENPRRWRYAYSGYDSYDEQNDSDDEGILYETSTRRCQTWKEGRDNFVHEFSLPSRSMVAI